MSRSTDMHLYDHASRQVADLPEATPKRYCDVAIIGSGPAGLSAAVELRRRGIERVWVFERETEPGGIPRHCAHPPYGIREYQRLMTGPGFARHNTREAEKAGVKILTRHTVVELKPDGELHLTSPDGGVTVNAQRVLLAVGARETPRSARLISGSRPIGVINTGTLQSEIYLKNLKPFERPLIIGTELVSLSAIWSCIKAGIRPVGMVESNQRPTARWPLHLFPHLCRVPLYLNTMLESIEGDKRVEGAWLRLGDGAKKFLECDGILLSGQFTPESALLRLSSLVIDPRSQGPSVDQFFRCSDPVYFAAGNLLRPIETAGWSWREGKQVAAYIADDLIGKLPLPSSSAISVNCDSPVKYCLPQKLIVGGKSRLDLQLRVTHRTHGTLMLKDGERIIWQRTRTFLPERRILIPLEKLDWQETTQLNVSIKESR